MTERSKKVAGVAASTVAGFGVGLGFFLNLDPSDVMHLLSEAAANQIAQAGFFFTLAAWLHSGRVKKEIKLNFIALTDAINNVAVTLREDLNKHTKVLEDHGLRIKNIEDKVK